MNDPFVSVILPNYNHAKYLPQRIESILNQTYQNFELIILDDCSSDNSREVIERYKDNPRISKIIFNEKNSGSPFKQWHLGFTYAKGEIIWIAESDDYCEPVFLEKCVSEYLKDSDISVVYTTSKTVDSKGEDLGWEYDMSCPLYTYSGEQFIKDKMCYGSAIWNASSAIFNKRVAERINPRYQDFKACGDKLFWIEMAEKGKVVHINEFLNYFRQHDNKVSPRSLIDGTTLREEYRITKYLMESGYLKSPLLYHILYKYYKRIKYGEFINENIRKELMKLWGFDNKMYLAEVRMRAKIYRLFINKILRKELKYQN